MTALGVGLSGDLPLEGCGLDGGVLHDVPGGEALQGRCLVEWGGARAPRGVTSGETHTPRPCPSGGAQGRDQRPWAWSQSCGRGLGLPCPLEVFGCGLQAHVTLLPRWPWQRPAPLPAKGPPSPQVRPRTPGVSPIPPAPCVSRPPPLSPRHCHRHGGGRPDGAGGGRVVPGLPSRQGRRGITGGSTGGHDVLWVSARRGRGGGDGSGDDGGGHDVPGMPARRGGGRDGGGVALPAEARLRVERGGETHLLPSR